MGTDPIFTAGSGRSAKRTSLVSVSRPWRTWREATVYSRNGGKGTGIGPYAGEVSWGRGGVLSAGECTDSYRQLAFETDKKQPKKSSQKNKTRCDCGYHNLFIG